jgi:hypothetical protein
MRLPAALAGLSLLAVPAAAEVAVRVADGHVELVAKTAPLSEVLDRLARQTGMKVVYEGPAPRQLVTVTLRGRSPAETVLSLLEGLGLNFALVADPAGSRVQTLLVAGTASASTTPASTTAAARPAPGPRRPFGPPPGASPETVDPAFEEEEDLEAAEDPAFAGLPPGVEPDPGAAPAVDPSVANPGAPPANAPGPPGLPMTPPSSPFSASPFTPQPQPFPPLPPGVPGTPTAPGAPPQGEEPATPPPD